MTRDAAASASATTKGVSVVPRTPSLLPDTFFHTLQTIHSKSPPPLGDILLDAAALACIFAPHELPPNRPTPSPSSASASASASASTALTTTSTGRGTGRSPTSRAAASTSTSAAAAAYDFSRLAHRLARNGLLFRPRTGSLSGALSAVLPFGAVSPLHAFVVQHLFAHRLWGVLELYVSWYDLKAVSEALMQAATATPNKAGAPQPLALFQTLALDSFLQSECMMPDAALVGPPYRRAAVAWLGLAWLGRAQHRFGSALASTAQGCREREGGEPVRSLVGRSVGCC